MFQAQQNAVVQEANIALVKIRFMEIEYFTNFFSQFGTQCFVLAGFICGSISQTAQLDDPGCPYIFIILYNSAAATCVALATGAMLASVFIAVFGQGMAIRGPAGSLVKTIDGMVKEQYQAVVIFVFSVIAFTLQSIGMSWIMMDQACAIASTILFILYAIYTYNVSLRIYNRFWWDKTRTDWRDEVDRVMELNELAPSIDTLREQYGEKKVEQALKVSLHRGYLNDSSTEQQRRSVISNMLSLMYNPKQQSKSPKNNVNASKDTSATPSERGSERLDPSHPYFDAESVISDSPYMEINSGSELVTFADNSSATGPQIADLKAGGYLTMKHKAKGLSMKDPWERRYFIIKNDCVYYYKDRRSFDLEPSKPLNIRPIDLEGYTLYADSEAPPYLLSLVPSSEEDIRKTWVFRADTLAEFRSWKEIFSKALESANAKQH